MNPDDKYQPGQLPFAITDLETLSLAIKCYDVLRHRPNSLVIKDALQMIPAEKFRISHESKLLKEYTPRFISEHFIVCEPSEDTKFISRNTKVGSLISLHVGKMNFETYEKFMKAIIRSNYERDAVTKAVVEDLWYYRIMEREYYLPLLEQEDPGVFIAIKRIGEEIETVARLIRDKIVEEPNIARDDIHHLIKDLMAWQGQFVSKKKIAVELISILYFYKKQFLEGSVKESMQRFIEDALKEPTNINQTIEFNTLSSFNEYSLPSMTDSIQKVVLLSQKRSLEDDTYIFNKSSASTSKKPLEGIDDFCCSRYSSLLSPFGDELQLKVENIKLYDKKLKPCTKTHAFCMIPSKTYELFYDRYMDGSIAYYAVDRDQTIYLICSDELAGEVVLIPLCQHGQLMELTMHNLCCMDHDFNRSDKIKVKRISFGEKKSKQTSDISILTEGVDIDREGNVKLALPRNATYMDKYASLHRMITQVSIVNDTADVKMLLAEMFQLIDETEQEMRKYKDKKKKEKRYRDAEKARMFLINDFKRYMTALKELEPEFNFPEYYKDNEYDIRTYHVKSESILGIKQLIKRIMMN